MAVGSAVDLTIEGRVMHMPNTAINQSLLA